MPNQIRKSSKSRRDKRRTHYVAVVPATTLCPQCGAVRLSHNACPECGYYNGRKVVTKTA